MYLQTKATLEKKKKKKKKISAWLFDDALRFFSDLHYNSICCEYSFELHRQVDAIQIGTHKICLYKVDKKDSGCNLKSMELLDCALIGVYAVIRSNTVKKNINTFGWNK